MVLSTNEVYKIAQAKYEQLKEKNPLRESFNREKAINFLNGCLLSSDGSNADLMQDCGRIYDFRIPDQKDFITDLSMSVYTVKPENINEFKSIIKGDSNHGK